MYTILNANESRICRHVVPSMWTSEYYNYCVSLFVTALSHMSKPLNVILGDIVCDFKNDNKTIKIDIQSEHTLVKLGGRSVDEIVWGDIDVIDGDGKYLIRIPNYKYYAGLDATIEYSIPNLVNLQTNDRFADYLRTAIYIAPTIYDTIDFRARGQTDTITLSNPSDRRAAFFSRMPGIMNVQGVLSKDALKGVYDRTKIMVNLHQTDHHHTFEELRVLPALCNGVIVVSEDVPLKETVPYANAIVWSSYADLADTVQDVQHNYDYYFQQIFTSKLEKSLMTLRHFNVNNLINYLTNV